MWRLAGLAYGVARRFSQPVERLADAARQVQATGQVAALNFEMKTVELQHLRAALQNMAQGLLEGRAALQSANAELEQRVAERTVALHRSEQRYLSILEDQTEIICRFDASNRMTFVNEAFCRLFHLRRDEVVGQVWAPIVHPDDLPLVTQKLRSVSPSQPLVVVENRVVAGDGTIRWCQFSNRALFDDDGQLVEWQSVGRDSWASSNSVPFRMRTSTSPARARSASGTLASMKSDTACSPPVGLPSTTPRPANNASARTADCCSCSARSGREASMACET